MDCQIIHFFIFGCNFPFKLNLQYAFLGLAFRCPNTYMCDTRHCGRLMNIISQVCTPYAVFNGT